MLTVASFLAACLRASEPSQSEPLHNVPVLTVCEALTDLRNLSGKDVVIVGRSGFTFEGTFISEDCEADGRILIQGHRWLSMVELAGDKLSDEPLQFNFDENLLREKLRKVETTTKFSATATDNPLSDKWIAVFGRLISPATLRPPRPPSSAHSKNVAGNGFGANGSVPAQIMRRASFNLSKSK